MRRGISLLELLLTLLIVTIATAAVARTFSDCLRFEETSGNTRDAYNDRFRIEDTISRFISGASLHSSADFLVSPVAVKSAQATDQSNDDVLGSQGSPTISLTTYVAPVSSEALAQSDQGFSSLNERFGPVGGPAEVELSTTPVGDAGEKTGLFLRVQRPPDTDPTQGGTESLLSDRVQEIRFEFYDGSQWQNSWDTTAGNKGKLPQAVRVSYLLNGDPAEHQFIVSLPLAVPPTNGGSS